MFFKKRGFTLVEMMIAILLSAIVIFFSYTLTISAYKMFSKISKTSKNYNNIQFFEEVLKKSITEAQSISFTPDKKEMRCTRYDKNIGDFVVDVYSFENSSCKFGNEVGEQYESFPKNIIKDNKMFGPTKLFLKTELVSGTASAPKVLVLNNIRAFYYRPNKYPAGGQNSAVHWDNIMIGVAYEEQIVPNISKIQTKSFCFASRQGSIS